MSTLDIANYLDYHSNKAQQKVRDLEAASARIREELGQRTAPPSTNSWVSKLGLDPEGSVGTGVNLGASLVSGTSRLAGHLASLPTNLHTIVKMGGLDEADIQSYNRIITNAGTEEDVQRLSRPNNSGEGTIYESIDSARKMGKIGSDINAFTDLSGIVHQGRRDALNKQLGDGFNSAMAEYDKEGIGNKISGVAKLAGTAIGGLVSNPGAIAEYAVENAPQLGIGLFGRAGLAAQAASNIGYAAATNQEGYDEYAKKNQGQLPPEDIRRKNLLLSGSLALAEQAGDLVGVVGAKAGSKLFKSAKEAAEDGLEKAAARTSFKDAVLNTVKASAGSASTEGPTEGFQQWAEGEIKGKPATGAEIFSAGVIGAGSGGVLTGGLRGAKEGSEWMAQTAQDRLQRATDPNAPNTSPKTQDAVKQAVETGDVASLVDPASTSYAPEKAVAALFGFAQKNPEKAQDSLNKADEILTVLRDQKDGLQDQLRPDAEIQADIDRMNNALNKIPDEHPQKQAIKDQYGGFIQDLTAQLGKQEDAKKQMASLEKQIEEAERNYDHLDNFVNPRDVPADAEQLSQLVQAVQQPTEDNKDAGEKLVSMAMAHPDSMDDGLIKNLANNKSNGLTDEQRKFFRELSEARLAANALRKMGDVSNEVLYGTQENLGIQQYKSLIGNAVSNGNKAKAERYLNLLDKFVESHAGKAAAAEQAMNKGLGTPIIKTKAGEWVVGARGLDRKAIKQNGGLVINSPELVDNIESEAHALKTAQTYLGNAVVSKFGSATTSKKSRISELEGLINNVQNVSQQGSGTETKGAVNQAQTTKGSRQDGTGTATQGSAREVSTKPSQEAASAPLTNHTPKEYLVSDPIDGEDHQSETVRIVRSGENTAILRGDNLIDITAMLNAGYSIERAIAQSIGLDTTGKNVKAVGNSQQSREALVVEKKNSESSKPTSTVSEDKKLTSIQEPKESSQPVTQPTEPPSSTKIETQPEPKPDAEAKVQASAVTEAKAEGPQTQAVKELEGRREGYTYSVPSKEQNQTIKATLEKLAGFYNGLGSTLRYVLQSGEGVVAGTNYTGSNIIGLRPDVFTEGVPVLQETPEQRLERILAHELAHKFDEADGYPSTTSKGLLPGGAAYSEAVAAHASGDPVLKAWFDYVFDNEKPDTWKAKELYAQLNALYITRPELFNEHFPKSKRVLDKIHGRESTTDNQNESAVVESASVSDRAGSPESSGQPAVETNGEVSRQSDGEPTDSATGLEVLREGREKNKEFEGKNLGDTVERTINGKKETPTVFQLMNRAAAWLTQRFKAPEEDGGTPTGRPLVVTPRMLSKWKEGMFDLAQHFPTGFDEEGVQTTALGVFLDTANDWYGEFRDTFKKGSLTKLKADGSRTQPVREDYLYEDPVQDLVREQDGKTLVEQNLVAAVMYGAFSWYTENSGTRYLDNEGILAMLGMSEGEGYVRDRSNLKYLAGSKDYIANSIGERIVKALGLNAKSDASLDYMPNLRMALGLRALQALERLGYIETQTVSEDLIEDAVEGFDAQLAVDGMGKVAMTKPSDGSEPQPIYRRRDFIEFKRDNEGKLLGSNAQTISESQRGSSGVLNKLFTAEDNGIYASTEPAKFVQKYASKTKQEVPARLREILNKAQQIPHKAIPAMMDAYKVLGEQNILVAAGMVDLNAPWVQAMKRDTYEANNDNLIRQFRLMMGLINSHPPGTAWYARFDVWSNFRVGQKQREMNLQSSKIHRYSYARPGWESTINLKDDSAVLNYEMALAQAFGMKVDQKPFVEVQADFKAMLEKADNRIAELALLLHESSKDPDNNPMSEEDKAAIGQLAANREGMQTLQALVSLGQYLDARQNKADSFKTTLLVGVDGKTNGPILTQIALGAGFSPEHLLRTLNMGGFYSEKDGTASFNEWYDRDHSQDLYETLGSRIDNNLNKSSPVVAAVETILGSFVKDGKLSPAGRKLAKTPTTAVNFGSGLTRSYETIEDSIIEGIYEQIEALAKQEADQDVVNNFTHALNTLINKPKESIPNGIAIKGLVALKLNKAQELGIRVSISQNFQEAVREAMKETYEHMLDRRNTMTNIAQISFQIFDVVYNTLRNEEMNRLMDTGEMAFKMEKEKRVPLHDLTGKQEKALLDRLKTLMPRAHTIYSVIENDLDAGLMAAKHTQAQGQQPFNKVRAFMGKPVRGYTGSGKPTWEIAANGNGYVRKLTNPGVSLLAAMIHSMDSGIMHWATDGTEILNNHDEGSDSASNVIATAQALNKATWDALSKYSPMKEGLLMLDQAEKVLVEMHRQGKIINDDLWDIAKQYGRVLPYKVAKNLNVVGLFKGGGAHMHHQYGLAEETRLKTLGLIKYINQYTWEGGHYEVTAEDHQQLQKQLDAHLAAGQYPLSDKATYLYLLEAIQKANKEIIESFKNSRIEQAEILKAAEEAKASNYTPAPVEPRQPTESDPTNEGLKAEQTLAEATVTKKSVFGDLGKPKIPSDPSVVGFFERKGTRTAGEVLKALKTTFAAGQPNANAFMTALLGKIEGLISPDVVVQYITKDMTSVDIKGDPVPNARGWTTTTMSGSAGEIYVLSPDFAASGLTPELLVHELLHIALKRAIESKSKAAQAYVAELKELLSKAKEYVENNGLTQFQPAVANVDELLAWGLSNQEFQQQVLAKVFMKSNTIGKIVKAMQAFVANVAKLLGFQTTQETNGLGVLIANASGLIHVASKGVATKKLGDKSKTTSMPMQNPQEQAIAAIQSYDTQSIFNALASPTGNQSDQFTQHLGKVLSKIVNNLHGPLGLLAQGARKTEAANPYMAWLKAVETGKAPFAAQVIASPLASNAQQDFVAEQVEATVLSVLDEGNANTSMAYRELSKLYMEAYRKIKPENFHKGDWATATQNEKDIAQQKFDFVFKMESTKGKQSDYLARFAALGLGNQEFSELLGFKTDADPKVKTGSIMERLLSAFQKILSMFSNKVTKTYGGQQADEKLMQLVDRLVDIEAKKRHKLAMQVGQTNVLTSVEDGAKSLTNKAKEKLVDIAGSDFFRNSQNSIIRATGSMTRTIAGNRTEAFMEHWSALRDQLSGERTGFVASFLQELKHPATAMKSMLMRTKRNEQQRKELMSKVARYVLEGFSNKGENLTTEDKAAISSVFLRTGAHVLTDSFNMAELSNIVTDVNERNRVIADFEDKLSGPFKAQYIVAAKALAYYKATGLVRHPVLMLNANNIARLYGTPMAAKVDEDMVSANEPSIEALVALYALSYSKSTDLARARDIIRTETLRTDGNGVEFVLGMHKKLEKESKEAMFGNDPVHMMHGYTPEIMNPYTKLAVAYGQGHSELINMGYTKVDELGLDPQDPSRETKTLYVLKDGGLSPYVSGILSMDSMRAKGSPTEGVTLSAEAKALAIKRQSLMKAITPAYAASFDPSKVKDNFMAPVLDSEGRVSGWRYMMNEHTKDTLMERNNSFEHLLGATAGALLYKPNAQAQNIAVVEALKEQYDQEFATDSSRFIEIGPKSKDPESQELWAMLPKETRQAITDVWGKTPLTVRKDAVLILFGARKLSAAGMFQRANKERIKNRNLGLPTEITALESINAMEKMVVYAVESVLTTLGHMRGLSNDEAAAQAAKAAVMVTRAERGWQEIVAEAKDIIVVKTGVVLAGNIWSNLWMLGLSGVPMKDILRDHYVALKATTAYRKDNAELERLIAIRDTGYTQGNDEEIRREIVRLEDALARNPVTKLIDEGLMPTIVDDVVMEQDPYSYKSALTRKMEGYGEKLHPGVKKAGKMVYMAHDTALYQFLNTTTQLSDFVARYTLYNHLTNRKDQPMSHKDAVMRAMDSFVNYDIPMHPLMQYSDDMGLTMFTKYFLRIQREIGRMIAEKPARALSAVLAGQFIDLGPTILESHWLGHVGNNPIKGGAFEYAKSLDDLGTVAGTLAVFK